MNIQELLERLDAEIMSTDFDVALALPYIERWLRKCKEVSANQDEENNEEQP